MSFATIPVHIRDHRCNGDLAPANSLSTMSPYLSLHLPPQSAVLWFVSLIKMQQQGTEKGEIVRRRQMREVVGLGMQRCKPASLALCLQPSLYISAPLLPLPIQPFIPEPSFVPVFLEKCSRQLDPVWFFFFFKMQINIISFIYILKDSSLTSGQRIVFLSKFF